MVRHLLELVSKGAASGAGSVSAMFIRAVGRVDRNMAVARIRPMAAYVDDVLAPRRAPFRATRIDPAIALNSE